jgi:amidohydrolase
MLDAQAWAGAEKLVRTVVEELMAPYGVLVDVDYAQGVPPVVNTPGATQRLAGGVVATLGPAGLVPTAQSLGGEDFAWYLEHVPGAMARLGTGTPGGPAYDLHRGDLRIDERAVLIGAQVLASTALRAGAGA